MCMHIGVAVLEKRPTQRGLHYCRLAHVTGRDMDPSVDVEGATLGEGTRSRVLHGRHGRRQVRRQVCIHACANGAVSDAAQLPSGRPRITARVEEGVEALAPATHGAPIR
jgi:hypothetical protein